MESQSNSEESQSNSSSEESQYSISLRTVKPLNTYTLYHRKKITECHILSWGERCYHCSKYGCSKCTILCTVKKNVYNHTVWQRECYSCLTALECIKYFNILRDNNNNNLTINICKIISHYSIGVVINCCHCKKEFLYLNRFEFEKAKGVYHYCYTIPYSIYQTKKNEISMVYCYGEYRRLFCMKCNKLCKKCIWCGNVDIEMGNQGGCHNHPSCSVCDTQFRYWNKCKLCQKDFCPNDVCGPSYALSYSYNCPEMCRKCMLSEDEQMLKKIVFECWPFHCFPLEVIDIISDYAMGYVVECCNQGCETEIIINDKLNYYNQKANQKFYEYTIVYFNPNDTVLNSVYMYGRYRRIFCKNCKNDKLFPCEYQGEGNYAHSVDWQTMFEVEGVICGKHRFCSVCGDRTGLYFKKCKICRNNFCGKYKHDRQVMNGKCSNCIATLYNRDLQRCILLSLRHVFDYNHRHIVLLIVEYILE